MLSLMRRCIDDYNMISPGDSICVGVSGGKDSLSLLYVMSELRRFYPHPFTLKAVTLDTGFEDMDFSHLQAWCAAQNVELKIVPTDIKQVVFDIRKEKSPCSLCAKMRRGILHDAALEMGCKKVALGHHFDDAAETYMMSLLFEGRIHCFTPVTYLDRRDITLVRPFLYIDEQTITRFAQRNDLPVVHNPCTANGKTKRQEIKELLAGMEQTYPEIKQKIIGAMQSLPLKGWQVFAQEISAD